MTKRPAMDVWTTVDVRDDHVMRRLANDLACTVGELRIAVERVGPAMGDVRNYLKRSRALDQRWQAGRARHSH
jgi:hypothetical protein